MWTFAKDFWLLLLVSACVNPYCLRILWYIYEQEHVSHPLVLITAYAARSIHHTRAHVKQCFLQNGIRISSWSGFFISLISPPCILKITCFFGKEMYSIELRTSSLLLKVKKTLLGFFCLFLAMLSNDKWIQ